jgi:Domain of unknown function (DUF1990)
VGDAGEQTRDVDGRTARVSFWNYRTLEGHVEAGQRDYEVWKWLDSGEVEFRTHAFSRPADTNPLLLLGFRLLGRHKQVEFGRRACARMALLTAAALRRHDNNTDTRTFDGRLLGVYLRDHHALLIAAEEVAARLRARTADQRALAEEVISAATDDRAALQRLLHRLDRRPSPISDTAVRVGERLGRLKLNGRIIRPSPLSAVTELEGCQLLLQSTRALWTSLAQLGLGPDDVAERANRVTRLLDRAETLRLRALEHAVHPAVGAPR